MPQNNTVTRIYQGRVKTVTDLTDKVHMLDKKDVEELLWKHHTLYQDAVNYYLFALASMAASEDSFIGKLRLRMRDVWNDFRTRGELRPGLKHSLIRTLGHADELMDESKGIDNASRLILEGNGASPETLEAAIAQIADKCIVNGNVKQQGATYIARACDSAYHGNYECDAKANAEASGKIKLTDALYSEDPVSAVRKISDELEIGWFGIKTQTGKFFEGDDAKRELREAVLFYQNRNAKIPRGAMEVLNSQCGSADKRFSDYLERIDSMEDISFGRNNKTSLPLRNMAWMLKFFPDELTVSLAKTFIAPLKPGGKPEVVAIGSMDPVQEARGSRGYIFPSFTSISFAQVDANAKKLDKEAFVEALKTINQFRQKTEERQGELERYKAAFAWMNGEGGPKPPNWDDEGGEDGDTAPLPILKGDSRWECLKRILAEELGVANPFTQGLTIEYGLTQRTVRCADIVFREWEKTLKDAGNAQDESKVEEQLVERLNAIQTEKSEVFGSAALFRELARPTNWRVWRQDWREGGPSRSSNILADAVLYSEIEGEIERLSAPIRFTPADERFSRRQCDLKPFTSSKTGHVGEGRYDVYLTVETDGKHEFKLFRLEYTAPRLHRDGVLLDGKYLYYPPALQAMLEKDSVSAIDFKSVDVQLMPDFDRNGEKRFLLNFLPTLDVSYIQEATGSSRFAKQFYYANNANVCLLWPSYGDNDKLNWFSQGKPFDIVSVDLGQRTAGALSRITVTPEPSGRAIPVGGDGSRQWYAQLRHAELLRLPGEGGSVIAHGRMEKEPYGRRGRLATKEETEEALSLAKLMSQDSGEQLMLDNGATVRFFPEQNDRLLIAARRMTGRLRQLARFHYGLESGNVTAKLKTELEGCQWLPKERSLETICSLEADYREKLPDILLKLAGRILPLRGRGWRWEIDPESRSRILRQTEKGSEDTHRWIRGQRGLSFERLDQLEEFRTRCQAVNRILMGLPGAKPMGVKEMRETPIPDPCPDVLMRLDEMKEQRVNQTANLILAQALGLRHRVHMTGAAERRSDGIHGEYERMPGLETAAFIAVENLSRYRFSQDRSRNENSRLMKWTHRAVRDKLVLLCEVYGIPVVEVNAAYSSKFSPEGIPGFRCEELSADAIHWSFAWNKVLERTDSAEAKLVSECLDIAEKLKSLSPKATVLMPRNGGPEFLCFCNDDRIVQADINASFNIGLRAVAQGSNLGVCNRLSVERGKAGMDIWRVRLTSKYSKMVYTRNYDIQYAPSDSFKGVGGNIFVLGCTASSLLKPYEQRPRFVDADLDTAYPDLMFGSALWRDLGRQLRRCIDINRKRLEQVKIRKGERHA